MCKCFSRYGKPKKRWPTRDAALGMAGTMKQRYHENFNVYQCEWCGFWHVGRRHE